MEYKNKLGQQSNYWYNDGLKKAKIRDLSGAIVSLKKSLQFNRNNIDARNLLGLCYYGRGEVIEALVEWILSKNFKQHDNLADYYIQKIHEDEEGLQRVNSAIKRYNHALARTKEGGIDVAAISLKKAIEEHPDFVKAYQLLALIYSALGQENQARALVRKAYQLDRTDPITLKYMHELEMTRKEQAGNLHKNEQRNKNSVSYTLGNETIIQPISSVRPGKKKGVNTQTIVNIVMGAVIGMAFMGFLVMPATNYSKQKEANNTNLAFSEQIASQEAQISALKKELEDYRSTDEDTTVSASDVQDSYEIVLNIYPHYEADDMTDAAMVEELLKVKVDALGTLGREDFDEMTGVLYERYGGTLYSDAQSRYDAVNYAVAIEDLESLMEFDEGYGDGAALLLLAQCYEGNGDQDKANLKYQQVVSEYPNTDYATTAQAALDAQKTTDSDSADGTDTDTADGTDTDTTDGTDGDTTDTDTTDTGTTDTTGDTQ